MNWKFEAREKLQRLDAMRQAATSLPEELERIGGELNRLHDIRGDGADCADMWMNLRVTQCDLNRALEGTRRWLNAVEGALGVLSPEERLILNRLYVYPEKGGVDRLCGDLRLEQSSIYRRRDKALHRFAIALYGVGEGGLADG